MYPINSKNAVYTQVDRLLYTQGQRQSVSRGLHHPRCPISKLLVECACKTTHGHVNLGPKKIFLIPIHCCVIQPLLFVAPIKIDVSLPHLLHLWDMVICVQRLALSVNARLYSSRYLQGKPHPSVVTGMRLVCRSLVCRSLVCRLPVCRLLSA
jgi:hypothetical protein